MMKNKIYFAYMLGSIVMGILCGCGTSENRVEPTFVELDILYLTNSDGTYTYEDNIYKYKIEVSGLENERQVTFIILTNNMETSFDDITYNLKKGEISTEVPEFVILGWY